MQPFLGPYPEEIERPPILPVPPMLRLQRQPPNPELIQRFLQLPPELRQEVRRFQSSPNRQLLQQLINYYLGDIVNPEDVELLNQLFRRYRIPVVTPFTIPSDAIVPDAAILTLLNLIADLFQRMAQYVAGTLDEVAEVNAILGSRFHYRLVPIRRPRGLVIEVVKIIS